MRIPLGEVVECLDRLRVPVKESERKPGPVPYYGANGQQGWIDRAIFNEPLVVVAEDGGHFASPSRGVSYRISGPSWVNNHGHVLRATDRVDTDYLFHSLRNFDFGPYISGSTRSKLTQKQLLQAEIPLPPLDEQLRIAAILDQADELRAKRRRTLALHDDLTQSIFLDMFGDLVGLSDVNPPLAELCTLVTDGTHQSPTWSDAGCPFLFISNVVTGEIDFATSRFVSLGEQELLTRRKPIDVGDVLYTTVGSYGVPAVVRDTRKFAFQRHIAHLKPNRRLLDPEFLAAMLRSPGLRRQADAAARGVAQKTINLGDIKAFNVIAPPMERQREFVRRVEAARAVRRTAEADQLDELFASLQSRAFAGQL